MKPSHRTAMLAAFGMSILSVIIWTKWTDISNALASIDLGLAAISLIALMISNVFYAWVFARIATLHTQADIHSQLLMGTFLAAQATKYVPGKVWSVLTQAVYLRGQVPGQVLIIANLVSALVALTVVFALGCALLVWFEVSLLLGAAVAAIGILAALALAGSSRIPVRLLRRIYKNAALLETIEKDATPPMVLDFRLAIALVGFMAFYLVGWVIFAGPSLGLGLEDGTRWVAIMSLSYVLGVLSMVPAGLGVRELAILGLSGSAGLDIGDAGAVAVLSRLMLLALDVCITALGTTMLLRTHSNLESR